MAGMKRILCVIGFALSGAASACSSAPDSKYPPLEFAGAAAMGSKNAPVVVMEFSDFHCPFCRRHATQVLPQLKRDFVETGKVLYVFRHLPLDIHPDAPAVAVAAVCAGKQGRFWELHDRFFSTPRAVPPTDVEAHAREVGVDLGAYRLCVSREGPAEVRADMREGQGLQINGTPAFVFGLNRGGTSMAPITSISGADTYDNFAKAIESVLRK
jgi:protein-disulfide isomerase